MAKQMEQQQTGGPGYDIPCYGLSISPLSYNGRSVGPGYDIPWYDLPMSPPSYSGRSGGPGYDIPWYDLPMSPPSYSGHSGGPGYDIPCSPPQYSGGHYYRAEPFVRRYSGGDGTALSPQQQPAPRPFSSFVRDQRYNGGHRTAPQQQPAPRPFSSFVRDQRYNGGQSTAPQQQPRPRPFCSFGWEQRGACRDGTSVNGLANSIAQGQAQRDVEMNCHGGPVSKVSRPPETITPLARGGLPLQARRQRRMQPPSGTLSPPTIVITDSAF